MAASEDRILDVVIVGAGISGIGMAAHLARNNPDKSYAIIERRDRIGGTWDLFRYPGVRSDSDMYTLGYAFEPWRDSKSIASGETIRAYLEMVAQKVGAQGRIRFGTRVVSADWDSAAGLWTLAVEAEGQRDTVRGRFLFMGSGYYDQDQPHDPRIPGLETFAGTVLHPQAWPEGTDLACKRVVVIGSGATAATIVPALAETAAHVTMLQRTPTYYAIQPSRDRIAGVLRRLMPERVAYALTRAKNTCLHAWFIGRSRRRPAKVRDYLRRQVKNRLGERWDDAAFDPPYGPWHQRLCLVPDGDLFDAVRTGRADVVTAAIDKVDARGIALDDGCRIDADAIVTATGLKLATMGKVAISLDGEAVDFSKHFYYRNCMFANVPNFAALFGYLNASWTLRVDMVCEWLGRLLQQMDAWQADVVTPVLSENHDLVEADLLWGFTSGYLERSRAFLPKTATIAPWRLGMDYFADRREMRERPIDDGVLQFLRLNRATEPPLADAGLLA